ncbi:MAG: hypothetical protein IJV73_05885 [Clostridia bacterium]|nr:hypothetical protein [Clostridia bacterium]
MKNNFTQKYFEQKNWTVLELIFLGIAIIAAFVFTFLRYGIPIGTPFFIVAVAALAFLKTQKIKDAEIDSMLNKMIANSIEPDVLKKSMKSFDLQAQLTKKGKDGKMRSSAYVVTLVEFEKGTAKSTCWRFDLLQENFAKESYTVTIGSGVSLVEKSVTVSGSQKEVAFLESDAFTSAIPVEVNDITVDKTVKKLCGLEK